LQENSSQGTEEKENKPRKASGFDGGHEENELEGNRSCAPVKSVNEAYTFRGSDRKEEKCVSYESGNPDREAELPASRRLKEKPRSRNDVLWTSDSSMKLKNVELDN
jgi:hypothetical protein